MTTILHITPYDADDVSEEHSERARWVSTLLSQIDYSREGDWAIEFRPGPPSRVRIGHRRHDVVTGEFGWGYGGWYHVSQWATDSEIVQAVFGLFKGYEEHECREAFTWEGRRIFGPHGDIKALWEAAEITDARPQKETTP